MVLFETPAGFALFKVLDEGKLDKVEVSDRRCGFLSLVLIGFVKFGLFRACLLKYQCYVSVCRICGRSSRRRTQRERFVISVEHCHVMIFCVSF